MGTAIDDVTIVGGGDAGLLTGLALRQLNPDVEISVVDDFSQEIPQVGKSTYLKIRQILHDSLDIDEQRFTSEVRPVWKASVYFRDWCDYPEFHYPFDQSQKFPPTDTPNAVEHYYHYYDELYRSPDHLTRCEEMVRQGKSPWYYSPRDGGYEKYEHVAYHLNTERFNAFLRTLCRERDVSLVDDEIVSVEASAGEIERVRSKRQAYESDLYVDATGFSRVLKSELESDFRDFPLPLDSAYNVRVEHSLDEIIPATVVESGEYGWFWHIDTYDNRDLGYVYASEYVSDEEARAEFLDHCAEFGDVSADDLTHYNFTSGYYEQPWEGNCIAIGNAVGFVEPLQSTGLTANAHSAVKLSNLLSGHGRVMDDGIRDAYNAWSTRAWESIYDFISIHYKYAGGETEFWEDMQDLDVSARVERLDEAFDANGLDWDIDPTSNDPDVEELLIFRPVNFYVLMHYMDETSAFYETNDFDVSEDVEQAEDDYYQGARENVDNHFTVAEFYKGLLEQ